MVKLITRGLTYTKNSINLAIIMLLVRVFRYLLMSPEVEPGRKVLRHKFGVKKVFSQSELAAVGQAAHRTASPAAGGGGRAFQVQAPC